jgi:hypothetical protein
MTLSLGATTSPLRGGRHRHPAQIACDLLPECRWGIGHEHALKQRQNRGGYPDPNGSTVDEEFRVADAMSLVRIFYFELSGGI